MALKEVSIVFHCASPAPGSDDRALFQRVNIDGTRTVIQACHEAGVQVCIISISCVRLNITFTEKALGSDAITVGSRVCNRRFANYYLISSQFM